MSPLRLSFSLLSLPAAVRPRRSRWDTSEQAEAAARALLVGLGCEETPDDGTFVRVFSVVCPDRPSALVLRREAEAGLGSLRAAWRFCCVAL